jgi:hypothetical protein
MYSLLLLLRPEDVEAESDVVETRRQKVAWPVRKPIKTVGAGSRKNGVEVAMHSGAHSRSTFTFGGATLITCRRRGVQ